MEALYEMNVGDASVPTHFSASPVLFPQSFLDISCIIFSHIFYSYALNIFVILFLFVLYPFTLNFIPLWMTLCPTLSRKLCSMFLLTPGILKC
jgi:hypothetical protein